MIIYIHGFGGSGEGRKAKAFREYYKNSTEGFIAPSLSYVPELAIKTLEELIESYSRDVKLIGSSLGGFYAVYLAQKYSLKTVLLNPSIFPYKTLKNYMGNAPTFYDNSSFSWSEKHINMLENYIEKDIDSSKFMLLVQKGDELLNPQEAIDKFIDAIVIVQEGGSHGFDGIESHFENIRNFLVSY